jgi:hypothetical protein
MTLKAFASALALVAGLAATGTAAADVRQDLARAEARVQVIDDPLDFEAVVSTERAFRSGRGVLNNPWNDNHLRAVIDKRTGAVRFEVRQDLQYHGLFRDYRQVNFVGPKGLTSAPLIRRGDNRDTCFGPDTLGCFGREDVAFEVDEATLRSLAAGGDAADQWAFKFKAAQGEDQQLGIDRAEVVALLNRVDAYRASRPVASARP